VRNFSKPLDKLHKIWYNIDTKEREEYTMAKATVKRTMYYPTFNEKTNEFDYKEVTHERDMTEKELNISIKYYLSCWLFVATIAIYALGLILALATAVTWWDLILIPITIAWAYLMSQETKYCFRLEDKVSNFSDYGFDVEILQWEQITQEQNIIAQEWRAEHEFEELIRKAKLTANSTDIAKAAIYYADHYIKGE
jgi:hypothetical protein